MRALIIVDLQNDFCPGGALPVPEGDEIINVVNKIIDKFDLIIASKDWHPQDTAHFKRWTPHCIQNTYGAEFPSTLRIDKIDKIFYKGTTNEDKGYSAFEADNLDLNEYLKERKINELYVCGLALDYCVKETAKSAIKNGYKTFIIIDATKAISEKTKEEAITELSKLGVIFIKSMEL